MLTLALNTSTSRGSLTLGDLSGKGANAVLKTLCWQKEKSHSEHITSALESLFKATGKKIDDVKLLVCGSGPGSFTGIRVGLSVIRTLAYTYNIPVIMPDDCFNAALNSRGTSMPVAVLIDAQQNKLFCGLYEWKDECLHTLTEPALVDLNSLTSLLTENQYVCLGDGYDLYSSFLPKDVLKKLIRDSKISDSPQAEIMLEAVSRKPENFTKLSWKDVHPLYLRSSAAEEVLAKKLGKIDNAPRS